MKESRAIYLCQSVKQGAQHIPKIQKKDSKHISKVKLEMVAMEITCLGLCIIGLPPSTSPYNPHGSEHGRHVKGGIPPGPPPPLINNSTGSRMTKSPPSGSITHGTPLGPHAAGPPMGKSYTMPDFGTIAWQLFFSFLCSFSWSVRKKHKVLYLPKL